jgi:hypothetical protein
MYKLFASVLVLSVLSVSNVGCAEKSTTTSETTVSTPDGSTKVTVEKEVTKTGEESPTTAP